MNSEKFNDQQRAIIEILLEEIDREELNKLERKLNTKEYEYEHEHDNCCKMKYIDKIYRKLELENIFSQEILWLYLYNLKQISLLRIYDKLHKINRYLKKPKQPTIPLNTKYLYGKVPLKF
jgi:hypothetical protein